MSERKVLNKYFPPDFNPAKIPRLKGMKKEKVFSIRTMAPFNMMCLTCRGYIFKAKKFNSQMEECEFTYLDLKEFRFHIKCPTCCAEIVYRTDRSNNDYVVESGAKRSFEAYTTAIRQAIKESIQEKEELEKNPIKALEKRTEESMNEFRMSNKIEDLMEQSKNDAPREEMIEDTLAILKHKQDMKKETASNEIKEFVKKQMQVQKQMEFERLEKEKANEISLDYSRFMIKNENSSGKLNQLKEILRRKRQLEADAKINTEEEATETKVLKVELQEVEAVKEIVPSNPFGLDYDSDSE